MNQGQILFHSGNCLNLKKPYPRECRLCLQFCPHGAINEIKEIDYTKCSECGVCMTICPSDGFVDRDMDNFGKYLLESETITLHCPLAKPEGYEIACLGMLDRDVWTTILLLADLKPAKILTGDCGKCDDRQACAVSVTLLKELLPEWQEQPSIKIEIAPSEADAGETVPEKEPNRMPSPGLGNWRERGKKQLKNLFPSLEAEVTYQTPKSRQWFAQALQRRPEKKLPYKAVKANEKCTSCGVCTKICPQQALQQLQKDGRILLIYEPAKCVQCNRCVDICGPEALRFEYVDFSYRFLTGKILLTETVARYCTQCGKQIYHQKNPQLCMACAAKDPTLKGVLY